jgi:uncharacterized protein (TIGR02145 family)
MKSRIIITTLLIISLISINLIDAQSIKIGKQEWMTKNLDVTTFRNGDPIPEAKTHEEWQNARDNKQPSWCWYDNDPINGEKFGRIYNWFAVNDERGLAPSGWHIPSDDEWTALTNQLGGEALAGGKLKSGEGWFENGNGTNDIGFNGLPSGFRNYNGSFYVINKGCYWWSSQKNNGNSAWYRFLYYSDESVYRYNSNKGSGFSVRCIKD